jgi:peptidoglycan/xylan/chitin deacetylase (PgdA/CDA1 family)
LERGVFTLSLDFELIWGTLEDFGPKAFEAAVERERDEVVDRLLEMLAEFEIPATWCVLGHLFLDSCSATNGVKHPEIVPPDGSSSDRWFAHDPATNEQQDPIYYGRSLIDRILACPVTQEIGGHSFSHVLFGDPACSRETAASELAESSRLAADLGFELRSFAFPQNSVGHLDLLREFGYTSYRGPEPVWYERSGRGSLRRAGHLWDVLTARTPPVSEPVEELPGLWNLAGSMMYFPMHGRRRHIPLSRRVRRAVKGLDRAARERRVFHLWLHPTNLADETETMFSGLRAIFDHAARLRDDRSLTFAAMGELVASSHQTEVVDVSSAAQITATNLRVDAVTAEVLRGFEAAGVQSMLLKGISVTRWLSTHDRPRPYQDSDLLVRTADLGAAERALGELGFRPLINEREMPEWWRDHSATWWRAKDSAKVDLHRTLIGVGATPEELWETLSAHTETIEVGGHPARVLSIPARAFHLALHAGQHGADWDRPLADVELAIEAADEASWQSAADLADSLRATAAFAAGLRLVEPGRALADRLGLPTKLPTEVALRAGSPPPVALGIEQVARARGVRARLEILWRKLVPPASFMRHWSPLARRSTLGLLLAYLWRPIWLLARLPAGFSAWRAARRRTAGDSSRT